MARYVCKNVAAAGLADRCELQVSYAIGGGAHIAFQHLRHGQDGRRKLLEIIKRNLISGPEYDRGGSRRPIYRQTAATRFRQERVLGKPDMRRPKVYLLKSPFEKGFCKNQIFIRI